MLEAASRFLCSLLELRLLVRGGEGNVVEVLTDPESLEDREGEQALLTAEDSEGEVATLESPSVALSGGGPPICLVASGEGSSAVPRGARASGPSSAAGASVSQPRLGSSVSSTATAASGS